MLNLAQTCPNSDASKAMINHRSYMICHLQPYKRFMCITCNCGTPLTGIMHVQNWWSNIKEYTTDPFNDPTFGKLLVNFWSKLCSKSLFP